MNDPKITIRFKRDGKRIKVIVDEAVGELYFYDFQAATFFLAQFRGETRSEGEGWQNIKVYK